MLCYTFSCYRRLAVSRLLGMMNIEERSHIWTGLNHLDICVSTWNNQEYTREAILQLYTAYPYGLQGGAQVLSS